MDKFTATAFFFSFCIIAIWVSNYNRNRQESVLAFVLLVLTIYVGCRDVTAWSDTLIYKDAFLSTHPLGEFSFNDKVFGYSEKGFILLGAIVKTFTSNYTFYFIFIAALTYLVLYADLKRYGIFPLIGLCVYLARFTAGREMVQIRSALAIPIIIWGFQYVRKNEYWKCLLTILIAYTLHTSAIVALPMLLFNKFKLTKTQIYIGLVLSFIIAGAFGQVVKNYVSSSDFINEMATSYVQEGSEKAFSNDLTNPVIYYQTFVLVFYTLFEKRLSAYSSLYYIIRNAYFYSTVLLIVLCQYAVLAARTSTIFATLEMLMVPIALLSFKKKDRWVPCIIVGIVFSVLFYLNWPL